MMSCCLVSHRGTKVCRARLAPQEREGLETLELRCVITHISSNHLYFLIHKLTQIHYSILRVSRDQRDYLVCRVCQGRTEPLDRR